jgi:hypothetical protein
MANNTIENIQVSVIIVNYNTCALTLDCIASVYDKTRGVSFEIIVVDNGSADRSAETISEHYPEIKVIEAGANVGFGKANNRGASYARGTYLFLLNSDTLLINDAISELVHFITGNRAENVGICGGNLYTANKQPNHSYATFYPSVLKIFGYRSQLASLLGSVETFNTSNKPKDVAIIIGADLLIKKKLFDQLGGFDPAFFMYIEDGELCLRVKKAGYRIVSVPAAKIIHYQGKSSPTSKKLIMEVTSYLYYFKKHHSKVSLFAYKIVELASAVSKFLIFSLSFKKEKAAAYLSLLRFMIKNIV